MKKLLVSVLLLNLLAACASQKPISEIENRLFPAIEVSGVETGIVSATAANQLQTESVNVDRLNTDPILAERSIYYPFDVYVVQDADKPVVQAHAQYLNEQATRKVRVEGNCDERGSNEYNLALGQRRADGVRKMLQLGGVKDDQIEVTSYGDEKPRLTCHEEKCWKENRRADLNYR
jgi:peptidoglycan-associated lipoprotein